MIPPVIAVLVPQALEDPLSSVCRCFFSRPVVALRRIMVDDRNERVKLGAAPEGPSGRYPGGTACSSIFATVLRSIPNRRTAALLNQSLATWHVRPHRLYKSTEYISRPQLVRLGPESVSKVMRLGAQSADEEHDGGGVEEGFGPTAMVASKSFASRRLRLIQAKKRSTTQRRGNVPIADLPRGFCARSRRLDQEGIRLRQCHRQSGAACAARRVRRTAAASPPVAVLRMTRRDAPASTRPRPSVSTSAWRLRPLI